MKTQVFTFILIAILVYTGMVFVRYFYFNYLFDNCLEKATQEEKLNSENYKAGIGPTPTSPGPSCGCYTYQVSFLEVSKNPMMKGKMIACY